MARSIQMLYAVNCHSYLFETYVSELHKAFKAFFSLLHFQNSTSCCFAILEGPVSELQLFILNTNTMKYIPW